MNQVMSLVQERMLNTEFPKYQYLPAQHEVKHKQDNDDFDVLAEVVVSNDLLNFLVMTAVTLHGTGHCAWTSNPGLARANYDLDS